MSLLTPAENPLPPSSQQDTDHVTNMQISKLADDKKRKRGQGSKPPLAPPPDPASAPASDCHAATDPGSKTEEDFVASALTIEECSALVFGGPGPGMCDFCLEVGKHSTAACGYWERVPKGAVVGNACDIVCRSCGRLFRGGCCGLDEGRGVLKLCAKCGASDHWFLNCPLKDRVLERTPDPLPMDFAPERKREQASKPAPATPPAPALAPTSDLHGDTAPGSKTEEDFVASALTIEECSALVFGGPGPGMCDFCLEVGKHSTAACGYWERVPKGAVIGDACDIVCRSCGRLFRGGCCGLDEGRGVLKLCAKCGASDHWFLNCPLKNRVLERTLDPLPMDFAPERKREQASKPAPATPPAPALALAPTSDGATAPGVARGL